MQSALSDGEPSSTAPQSRSITLQQQRSMFIGIQRNVTSLLLESDDGDHRSDAGVNRMVSQDGMHKCGGSATSTMEWRPLSMEQVLSFMLL
jgi:hypothetical protein